MVGKSMSVYYRTKAGETLDEICWQYYIKEVNLGTAAMAVDPRLLSEGELLDNSFMLGPEFDSLARGTVEQVLLANPGLADYPLMLPAGLRILLPEVEPEASSHDTIRLWD